MVSRIFMRKKPSVDDEASLWLARLDRGLTEGEQKSLVEWMTVSENRDVFYEMAGLWEKMDALATLAENAPAKSPSNGLAQSKLRSQSVRCFTILHGLYPVFASFFVIVLLWKGDYIPALSGISYAEQVVTSRYFSDKGETLKLLQPDGSELILNTNTQIELRYTNDRRFVNLLQGEIYVDVASDKARPFFVKVGKRYVRAVGTEFNVQRLNGSSMEVVVSEGVVAAGQISTESTSFDRAAETMVEAGNVILIESGTAPPEVMPISESSMSSRFAWQSGLLIFRGETLLNALKEVSRYSDIHFDLSPNIENVRIAGVFEAGDIDSIIFSLEQNFQVGAEYLSDDFIRLTKKVAH